MVIEYTVWKNWEEEGERVKQHLQNWEYWVWSVAVRFLGISDEELVIIKKKLHRVWDYFQWKNDCTCGISTLNLTTQCKLSGCNYLFISPVVWNNGVCTHVPD